MKLLVINSNFTSELIQTYLDASLRQIERPLRILFAPDGQIFQQVMNPDSLTRSSLGFRVFLLHIGKLISINPNIQPRSDYEDIDEIGDVISSNSDDLCPMLVVSTPLNRNLQDRLERREAEERLAGRLSNCQGIYFVSSDVVTRHYFTGRYENYFDSYTDRIMDAPYSEVGYAAIAIVIARWVYGLTTPRRKVVVVDCDNTLWSGLCGESAITEIGVSEHHLALQQFLIDQVKLGRLVCICSKNYEANVRKVFDEHPDMILRTHHVVRWRVNWRPKSENIVSLSDELKLGLESFVMIDDDKFECESVRSLYPEVAVYQIPPDEMHFENYIRDLWGLDSWEIRTKDDANRTRYYQRNLLREQARARASSLGDFLEGLGLIVTIVPFQKTDRARTCQLVSRVHQFNLSGLNDGVQAIQDSCHSASSSCLVIRASDRFGDYGIVGFTRFSLEQSVMVVHELFLSCRALGKGVERSIIRRLSELAHQRLAQSIRFLFVKTDRNLPVQAFLMFIGASHQNGAWEVSTSQAVAAARGGLGSFCYFDRPMYWELDTRVTIHSPECLTARLLTSESIRLSDPSPILSRNGASRWLAKDRSAVTNPNSGLRGRVPFDGVLQ